MGIWCTCTMYIHVYHCTMYIHVYHCVSYTPTYVWKFICDISLEPPALGKYHKQTPHKQVYMYSISAHTHLDLAMVHIHKYMYIHVYPCHWCHTYRKCFVSACTCICTCMYECRYTCTVGAVQQYSAMRSVFAQY